MKNMKKYLYIAIAAIFAAGCSSLMEERNENPREVRFTTNLSSFVTKTVNPDAGFVNGDAFTVCALEPFVVDNVKYTFSGNAITSETPICWPEDLQEEAYFGAFYPYTPDFSILAEDSFTISVKTDQTTQENYHASDWLVATAEAMPGETVNLEFYHFLTRVDITIDGELESAVTSVSLGGVANSFNVYQEVYSEERVPIKAGEILLADGTKAWSCIVIPEENVKPVLNVTFADGTVKSYPVNNAINLESTTRYHAKLTLKPDGSLEAEFVFRIFDWINDGYVWLEPAKGEWQICGSFNDWDLTSAVPMVPSGNMLYADLELPREAEFKFVCNRSWDVNLGGADFGEEGFRTFPIYAGKTVNLIAQGCNLYYPDGGYVRVWLLLDTKEAYIEEIEAPVPDPEPDRNYDGWSLIGTLRGDSWSRDIPMYRCYDDGGQYALIYYRQGDEFKIRYNSDWAVNYGINGGNGYGGHMGVQDGPNITLPKEGYYEVFFYPNDDNYLYIAQWGDEGMTWGITGSVLNLGWNADVSPVAISVDDKLNPILRFNIDYNEGEEFKFRFQGNWTLDYGYASAWGGIEYVEAGNEYPIAQGGANIALSSTGNYDVYLDIYGQKMWVEYNGEVTGPDYSFSIDIGPALGNSRTVRFNVGPDVAEVRYMFYDRLIDDDGEAYKISATFADKIAEYNSFTFEKGSGQEYAELVFTTMESGYHTVVTAVMDIYGNWQGWYYWYFYLEGPEENLSWVSLGTGTYTDDFFASIYGIENLSWEVEVEQCVQDPTRIRMVYPYDNKFEYNDDGDWDATRSYDLEIVIADQDHVYIKPQQIGVNWGYGMMCVASNAGYWISNGTAFEEVPAEEFGHVADGVITFPETSLRINLPEYNFTGWFKANRSGAFSLVLPGSQATASGAPKAVARSARPGKLVGQLKAM